MIPKGECVCVCVAYLSAGILEINNKLQIPFLFYIP